MNYQGPGNEHYYQEKPYPFLKHAEQKNNSYNNLLYYLSQLEEQATQYLLQG